MQMFVILFLFTPPLKPQILNITVSNDVSGIGCDIFDSMAAYGSHGRLKGINHMKHLGMYNISEQGYLGLNEHETGHQWAAFVNFMDETGNVNTALRNPYNMADWDKKLDTDYSLMGGCDWQNNGDGTFTAKSHPGAENYCDLDLYLMGLIPSSEVSPLTLIDSSADTLYIQPGSTITGTSKMIIIQNHNRHRGCEITNEHYLPKGFSEWHSSY